MLPSALGAATVALGSWAGHLAGLGTAHALLGGGGGGGRGGRGRASSSSDDDGAMGAVMACARRLPELGSAALRSAGEMTRPMFLGIVVGGVDGNNCNNGGLSARERRERKEAWMHAARV